MCPASSPPRNRFTPGPTAPAPSNPNKAPKPASASTALLGGCASQNIEQYAAERPQLDLAQYFNGRITAHGIFQDRSGQVVRRFTVDMEGRWNGNQGVLDEHFTYSDGQKDRRSHQ